MTQAAVGLGGNLGETLLVFREARGFLTDLLVEATFSSLYRTAPQLDADQPPFWNAVAIGRWPGSADALLDALLSWEAGAGRQRDPSRPKGPRLIDLDLLVFGDEVRASPRLSLPHPGLDSRRFALEPLLELFPTAVDPRTGRLWSSFLRELPDQGVDRSSRKW